MDFLDCIPLNMAQKLIIDSLSGIRTECEIVDLDCAWGRAVARDLFAADALPPFARSSVDGYAVCSADTFGASEAAPALLNLIGEVAMGQPAAVPVHPGQAVSIPTGGMLPSGADAVVMLEHVERPDAEALLVMKTVAPGENVVQAGEDLAAGSLIIREGQKLAPPQIGVLAACGVAAVPVHKQPVVTVISTGDELVDIRLTPGLGQIRDVNSHALAAMLREAGCMVRRHGIIRDDYDQFLAVMAEAVNGSDMVILSGGSSVGLKDHAVKAIGALGQPGVLIHGIAMKPGKPTVYGMVGKVPVFGLPGHPVAAMTVCEQLVKPAVRLLLGQNPLAKAVSLPANIVRSIASAAGRDDFLNVRLVKRDNRYLAEPVLGKSGLITTIARADGMVHIPFDATGLYNDEQVEVLLFQGLDAGVVIARSAGQSGVIL